MRIASPKFLASILVACVLVSVCVGQEQKNDFPMLVEVANSSSAIRSDGHIPLSLNIQWPGQLITGDLEIAIDDGFDTIIGSFRVPDLVLSTGEHRVECMVPCPLNQQFQNQCDVMISFVVKSKDGRTQRHTLQPHILRIPHAGERVFVVTIAVGVSDRDTRDIADQFAFEGLHPNRSGISNKQRIINRSRRLSVDEFPTHPLQHCASDIVVLPDSTFGDLSQQQTEALLSWVRAGGSCCIAISPDKTVETYHVEALNELTGSTNITRLSNGKLQRINDTIAVSQHHYGLGRFVLSFVPNPDFDFRKEHVAFLWKFRREQIPFISRSGNWDWGVAQRFRDQSQTSNYRYDARYHDYENLSPMTIPIGESLLNSTIPTSIHIVPLWTMALTLLIYVAAIGPGDYFFLGAFKRRPWTWVLFPTLTVAFMVGSFGVSNLMMGASQGGGHMKIVDVTDGGTIARENLIDLHFYGSKQTVETKLVQKLFNNIDHKQMQVNPRYYQQNPNQPLVSGTLPIRGNVIQPVDKWSPQFHRTLSISPKSQSESSGFDWDLALYSTGQNLAQRIKAAFGSGAQSFLINGNKSTLVLHGSHHSQSVIEMVSRPRPIGLFTLLSQISPKCGAYLEDLAVLDPTNANETLLVILVPDGNEWTVYRKLYRN